MNRRHCAAAVLVIALCGLSPRLSADQDHPGLDELFARLQSVEDPEAAEQITGRIWQLWRKVDDEEVAAAMERGARALAPISPTLLNRKFGIPRSPAASQPRVQR